MLILITTSLFGVILEIGGASSRGRMSVAELWGCRLLGLALFLLGVGLLYGAHRQLLALGLTPAEIRKAEWAWVIGLGLGMFTIGGMGLVWLVDGLNVGPDRSIQLSGEFGALPMAVAFAIYGLAGVVLFLVGAVLHLRVRTGTVRK